MKGKVWRQKEKRWLVWEKLGGWKGGSEKEIGERKLSQWQKNVKEFCKEEVAESVEDGEEEKSGRARSPWRWETENVTLGEGEDSCVFLMAQGNVWVLSVLNAYHEFFSCEFLNNAFLLRQPLERKVAFPWVSIREWQLGCFFGRKKKIIWQTQLGCWISIILFGALKHNCLDSAEPSAQSQAVLQAYCRGMQSRTDGVINIPSSPTFVVIKHFLKSTHKNKEKKQPFFINVILFRFKAPTHSFHSTSRDCAQHGPEPHDKDHAHWDNLMLFLGNFSPQTDPFELVKLARKHYFPLHSPK